MILKFIVYSNLFVAICVMFLTWGTGEVFDQQPSIHHMLFVAFSTLLVYNLQRYFGGAMSAEEQEKPFVVEKKNTAIIRSLLPVVIILYCVTQFSFSELMILIPAGIISMLYVGDLFFNKKNTGLRAVPFLKIFLIAFVWTLVTAIFPIAHSFNFVEPKYVLVIIERMCFILAITIPFDIRDLSFDKASLLTIPQVFGIKNAKKISVLFLVIGAVCSGVLFSINFYNFNFILGASVFYILTAGLLIGVNKHRTDYYYTFWIEGSMLIWGGTLLMLG